MKLKIKTMLTADLCLRPNRNLFLCLMCASLLVSLGFAWKCLFEEFPVNDEKMRGIWFIYASLPQAVNICYIEGMDPYWNRITWTDYSQYAVELHCSLPWFRQQMIIYTRSRNPSKSIIAEVITYLKTVNVSIKDFHRINKEKCIKNSTEPIQRWHLSKYLNVGYHPHYVMPLVLDPNI